MPLTVLQPSNVTVMIKPVGALCNLDCTYCYYLPTKAVYDGHEHRMSLRTLEETFAGILPKFADRVTIAWQGGEPTLAGLNFFRKAIEFQQKYKRPTQQISHALQTNGTLLNDDWCKFLRENNFLVGLSVDGPERFHDHYRISNRKQGSHKDVRRGLQLLQKHAVDYNLLCVLNDVNVHHPDEVMGYLMTLGARWLQFIPAIEWVKDPEDPTKNRLAPFSPDPAAYGKFMCRVFDIWFEKHRHRVSIRLIDALLNKLVDGTMPLCINDASCHGQMTIEHDGAVFGCDHFVERRWQLAQIGNPAWENDIGLDGDARVGLTVHGRGFHKDETHGGRDIENEADTPDREVDAADDSLDVGWLDRVDGRRLGTFAARKQHLPEKCKQCDYKAFCYGGCPKHRSQGGEIAEPSVLCEGYLQLYPHAMERLQWLADFLRRGQMPPEPQREGKGNGKAKPAADRQLLAAAMSGRARIGRNDPCPCGSGKKFRRCHGAQTPVR